MTQAEKAALEAADLAQFEKDIETLPETEKALMRTVKAQITEAFKKQTEENRAETAKALTEALEQLKEQETIKAMAKVLENQGLAIKRIETASKGTSNDQPVNFSQALSKEINAVGEKLTAIKNQGGIRPGQELEIEVKAVVNQTTATTIGAGSTFQTMTEDTGVISPIRHRAENYLQSVTTGTIGTKYALWTEETTEQGTPIFIDEAAGKTQISVLYVEKTQPVQKIAVYSKVSTELLSDLPQLTSFIQNSMLKRVGVKVETELYSGAGTTVYLKGATNWATTFSAGNLANTIQSANEIDVINAVANQCILAYGSPNALFVHPDTLNKIFGLKSSTGEPLYKEYMDWNVTGTGRQLTIAGMRISATPVVTSGEFLGGDMKVLNVLFREALNIKMIPSGDDPINNLITLIVEQRLVQYASANDTPCLIKGDFATAIAALTSVA